MFRENDFNHAFDAMAGPSSERTPLFARMEGEKTRQYLGSFTACLSAMAVGTTMSWTSLATEEKLNLNESEFAWVGGALSIGAVFGAVPLGALANIIGRKKVLILLAPVMTAGYLLLAWADNMLALLLAGRLILGAVVGAYCVVTPMYNGEIAETSIRGRVGSFFQLLITIGIFIVYLLNLLEVTVFWLNIVCAIIPLVFAVLMLFFPDSPKWYLSKGYEIEARDALIFFRGEKYDVQEELDRMQRDIDEQQAQRLPLSKAFTSPEAKKGLFLALGVMVFQQFCGINAVIYYATDIFKDAKAGMKPEISVVVVGVFQIVSTYGSSFLVDRAGRRVLLILSGAFMAISAFVLGLYFYLKIETKVDTSNLGSMPLVSLVVFIVMFSIGYGPIAWLYMSEVFSAQIKETAMSLATVMNWLSVFIVTRFYSDLVNAIDKYGAFWFFSAISIIGCFFVCFCLVETKGKDTAQILVELGGGSQRTDANGTSNGNERRFSKEKF